MTSENEKGSGRREGRNTMVAREGGRQRDKDRERDRDSVIGEREIDKRGKYR